MCSHSASDAGAGLCCVKGLIARADASALSLNTRKTYETGWNSWARWAASNGYRVSKPTVERLRDWLACLHLEGKKPSTLRTYLAAVAHRLRGRRGPNPARHPRVSLLLAGLARYAAERGVATRQAQGLRWERILLIEAAAPASRRNQPGGRLETPQQARKRADTDIAMAAVGHNGALRCSELLALTWGAVDFSEGPGLATIWIGRSKTDQNGKGAAVPISEYAAQALARLRPEDFDPDARIFDFSPSTARRRLKAAAKAAGIDPAGISTHSLRVGMAQDLAASGTGTIGLMLAGRWDTTETAAQYARRLQAQHTPAAQYLKTQLAVTTGQSEPGETRRPQAA
ncbi:tyrosine-type recombinase/integrase [Candidatus Poriferisocius sp.]|uniref:tyrosine-type recombinase/integrase n=1 Tax=Candidatus Poriferisocius sp. TaxID=3101276 RepID=UPI003B530504